MRTQLPLNTQTMKAALYLSRKRKNKEGLCPVYCRVSLGHVDRTDFSTGHFVTEKEWARWERVEREHIGERLMGVLKLMHRMIADHEHEPGFCTTDAVRYYYTHKRPLTIKVSEVAREFIAHRGCTERTGAAMRVIAEQFGCAAGDVCVKKVLPQTIAGFQAYLVRKGQSEHTVHKKLRTLKSVFTFAQAKGYIVSNPFALFKAPPLPKQVLVQCTVAELALLRSHEFASSRLNKIRDLFLFQTCTGLSFGDLCNFCADKVVKSRSGLLFLKGERLKTGVSYYVPWSAEAASLAAKYSYALPLVTNQRYNSYLKEVAEITGIEKRLTTHVARKTFSQMMIDKGYSAESVTRMMGHESFNMTQKHYGRLSEARIEEEVCRLSMGVAA